MSHDNLDTIRTVYEAFARRDIPKVLGCFDAHIEWIAADHSPLADQSPYRGLDRVREGVFMRMGARFERFGMRVDELVGVGDKVIMLGVYEGKFTGAAKDFEAQVAHVWTLSRGKVTKFQQYTDTLALTEGAVARDAREARVS
jgi:ketosteroid isomerase-like protein